ncbi:MAG TPA: aminoglycoside phosphotransferase family protein [Bryobacteraceae bacterium]|nr:aminoglycoside phosphotransferase family protein [Bryobacteraceae bacterium]
MTSELTTAGLDLERLSEKIEHYLKSLVGNDITVLGLYHLGDTPGRPIKGFGYGTPIRVDYQTTDGERHSVVLHTISPGPFGHEHMADRARILLWSHQAFSRLPRHVESLDVGGFAENGNLVSLGQLRECFVLTEYAEGQAYASDLERLRDTGLLRETDLARADALCDYLVEIHRGRADNAGLYVRRNRELVGDGECIMGLADSYPHHALFTPYVLEQIEHRAVEWRWRLKDRTHRLRQVHGDFHPWNILFSSDTDFRLLDRSRGEYGDPADDVTCLTSNYLFFSLQRSGRLEGPFETLFLRFWERYLNASGDTEMLSVVAPFFAFRALVLASPVWYPNLKATVRERLLDFILSVLETDRFDPSQVNIYCGA